MIDVHQGDTWTEKGVWRGARRDGGPRTANLSCMGCGQPASLTGHEIASDGTVTPSVVCPYEDCDFHDYVRLIGWTP